MTTPAARRTPVPGVLMLAAAAVGLVYLVLAPLLWVHTEDGRRRFLDLPAAANAEIRPGTLGTAVTVTAAYTVLLGVAMLALVPVAVLVWRRWPPARPIFWGLGALLVAGQLVEVVAALVTRHLVAAATTLPGLSVYTDSYLASALFPAWYLPTAGTLAAAAVALLVTAALLLRRDRR